jgi:PHD/YefM family antitoxin component YafN of YafNO toxin-antitoxin module
MMTITADEIKYRGIAAAEPLVRAGAVHVLVDGQPQYVILTEARYTELMEEVNEAYVARVLASEAAIAAGRARRYATVEEHMAAVDTAEDAEDKSR